MRGWGRAAGAAIGAIAAIAAALCGPAPATARSLTTTTALGGSPFNVIVGDRGQLQGFLAGQPRGIFFNPTSLAGDAGFFLAFPEDASAPEDVRGRVFGFEGGAGPAGPSEYLPRGQSTVSGSGVPGSPLTQETRYAVTDFAGSAVAEVTQTTSYLNGQGRFRVDWTVTNASGGPLNFRALAAADFYYDGDDFGTGFFAPGPPRFVGGTNADTGRTGGLEEVSDGGVLPWTAYEALAYGSGEPSYDDDLDELRRYVWWVVDNAWDDGVGFTDTVMRGHVDNAGGVEWDQYRTVALAAGQQARFALVVRAAIPATLQLLPANGGRTPQGSPLATTVVALDTDGRPFAGRNLHWAIAGVNPGQGVVPIGADGTAAIVDAAANLGSDTVIAFVDLNANGVHDPNEPSGQTAVTVVDVTPPVCSATIPPGRAGGAGASARPVIVTITCNEVANLGVGGSATVTERRVVARRRRGAGARRGGGGGGRGDRRARRGTAAEAEASARRGRRGASGRGGARRGSGRRRAGRPVVRTTTRTSGLTTVLANAAPGVAVNVALPVPVPVARRFAGRRAELTVRVGATDASGNSVITTVTGATRLLPYRDTTARPARRARGRGGRRSGSSRGGRRSRGGRGRRAR